VEVAEDPVARPDDSRRLALDQDPERVAVAGEDGVDRGAFIGSSVVGGWGSRGQVVLPDPERDGSGNVRREPVGSIVATPIMARVVRATART
jgi:hypothetical protein